MRLESPLGRALGHGSAKAGADHWIAQRLTAVGLVPLGLWFAFSLVSLQHDSYGLVAAWAAEPLNAILLILLVVTLVYHSMLGLQVIIEDYVHGALGTLALIAVKFVHVILAVAGLYAIVVTSLGAGQ
jgi:succinate dehydrogenase / fumarate reductase membrane anchor subunit